MEVDPSHERCQRYSLSTQARCQDLLSHLCTAPKFLQRCHHARNGSRKKVLRTLHGVVKGPSQASTFYIPKGWKEGALVSYACVCLGMEERTDFSGLPYSLSSRISANSCPQCLYFCCVSSLNTCSNQGFRVFQKRIKWEMIILILIKC